MVQGFQGQHVYFIDNEVQQRVLTLPESVAAMEEAYREWDSGRAAIHPKTHLDVYNDDADTRYGFTTMHGGVQKFGLVAMRIKSDLQPNRWEEAWSPILQEGGSAPTSASKGAGREGTFCGLVYLFSARTGLPVAIMNDGYLQHVRVGACAGVAAKYLAREDAQTLCLLGSQWMARTHAPAMCAVRPIKRIKVYSPNRENREAFAREMRQKLEIEVEAMSSPQEAMQGADIVCCCTNSFSHAVFSEEWLEEGMFVSNVLSSEVNDDALARMDYVVKNQPLRKLENQIHAAGSPPEGLLVRNEGAGWVKQVSDSTPLLSEVIAGKARGRTNDKEITFFSNNEGTGIQFAAVGFAILERLRKDGDDGVKKLPLDWFLQDIPD